MIIPEQLIANCRNHAEREAWLAGLPAMLADLTARWSLRPGRPFEHAHVTCSWVAPVVRAGGASAVLKLGMPHMEGASEIEGLRFWNGNPTVQLLEADTGLGAMLLERCHPGHSLHSEPEHRQDEVIAALLQRLWKRSASSLWGGGPQPPFRRLPEPRQHPRRSRLERRLRPGRAAPLFRHLSTMLEFWRDETLAQAHQWPDAGLVREGLRLWEELGKPLTTDVLLATDLHAGNVLRSEREPWLVIDPKPFLGDRAYDVVQHLHNCEARLHADPIGLVKRLADLCEVDMERLRLWTFARAAADPRPVWSDTLWVDVAKALAP
jgi:streptomycin 6-kinase